MVGRRRTTDGSTSVQLRKVLPPPSMWSCASRVPERVGYGAETTQLSLNGMMGVAPDVGDRFGETATPTGESPNVSG